MVGVEVWNRWEETNRRRRNREKKEGKPGEEEKIYYQTFPKST
jgi:hypothetical protein